MRIYLHVLMFSGPDQVRPSDFKTLMKNTLFKTELVTFCIGFWGKKEALSILKDKVLYVSHEKCYRYEVRNGQVTQEICNDLNTDGHEEADTKVAYFISQLPNKLNVVVRCADTDILIILLGNMNKFQKNIKISLEYGTGNHRRYINVSKIYESIGEKVALGLPGYHAFTGCDYNPAFFGKGKSKPYKIFTSNEKFQVTFSDMANPDKLEDVLNNMEEFTCKMYSTTKRKMTKITKINDARVYYFYDAYGMIEGADSESLKKKMLSIDACSFPPCLRELKQQVLRAIYITSLWMNAEKSIPTVLQPTDYGWCHENGEISCKWFEGDEVPSKVLDIIIAKQPKGIALASLMR